MEDNYTLITFKYRSGWFQKEETIPFRGTTAAFIANRTAMGGPMPVILFSTPITEKEFRAVREGFMRSKGYL